jgi:hypothetical protein
MKQLLHLLAMWLIGIATLWAEPAGIMQWTGNTTARYAVTTNDAVMTFDPYSIDPSYGAFSSVFFLHPDATGINVDGSSFVSNQIDTLDYALARPFAVLSAGDFLVTNSAMMRADGEPVNQGGGSSDLTGSFAGSGFGIGVSGAATESATPWIGFVGTTQNVYPPWFPITASGASQDVMFLDTGNYVLVQSFDASVFSAGDSAMSFTFATDIVGVDPPDSVPEPRWVAVVACLLGFSAVARLLMNKKSGRP